MASVLSRSRGVPDPFPFGGTLSLRCVQVGEVFLLLFSSITSFPDLAVVCSLIYQQGSHESAGQSYPFSRLWIQNKELKNEDSFPSRVPWNKEREFSKDHKEV